MTVKATKQRPWSPGDERKLKKLVVQRMRNGRFYSARLAAPKLNRTTGAVKFKAMVMGVRFRNVNQPAGVQRRRFKKR